MDIRLLILFFFFIRIFKDGEQLKINPSEMIRVVINIILGFALGWLISFGFLNLDHPAGIGIISFISAGFHGLIWLKIFNDKKRQPTLQRMIILIQIITVLIMGGLFISQRFIFQNEPMISRDYEKTFGKLQRAIARAYPYFEQKGINWNQVYEKYQQEAMNARNDQEFQLTIAHMLGELEDAHTNVVSPDLDRMLYASVRNVGDLVIVDQVGYSAEMAGLEPGMLLVQVGGKSVDEIYPEIDISIQGAATPWARKIQAYHQLLTVPEEPDQTLTLKLIKPGGEKVELKIEPLSVPLDWKNSRNRQNIPGVAWKEINHQIGYIRIDRLWNNHDDLVSEFDSALEMLFDKQGIILDLRQNGGGDSKIAEKIAGRFLDQTFMYGQEKFTTRLYKFAWRKSVNYSVKPRGQIYTGKLVLLTDYQVMSSAEWLVGALVDSGRAISVGRVTGGASGNPIKFSIPGGMVRYSTAAFYRPNGRLIEGVGYSPVIPVEWTLDDFISGIDPDIQAALNWISAPK